MRKMIATVCWSLMWSSAGQACEAVVFDYSSFTRPPQKLDVERFVAGREDGNFLSVGLRGVTLQISPANYALDAQLEQIWATWADRGERHMEFANFHDNFTQPVRIDTPFAGGTVGYWSEILPARRPADQPDMALPIVMVFLQGQGGGVASLYINNVGDADMDAVMAELAALTVFDTRCVSESGAYEGRFERAAARFVVFPVEAFLDPL